MFKAKLDVKLLYLKYDYQNLNRGNYRNGTYKKTLKSDIAGEFKVKVPSKRNGNYEPKIVKNYKNDISSIDKNKKVLKIY